MKLVLLEEEGALHFWPEAEQELEEAHLVHEEPSGEVVVVAEGSSHAVELAEEGPEVLDFEWEVLAVQILSFLLGKEEVQQTGHSLPLASSVVVVEVEALRLLQNLLVAVWKVLG